MILAVNITNSNIILGAFQNDHLLCMSHISTHRQITPDQYAITLRDVFSLNHIDLKGFVGAVIASVVPELTAVLKKALEILIPDCNILAIAPGIKTGLDIGCYDPSILGADFACSAVYALHNYPLPCIIIDLGTATKLSVVDKSGHFLGCSILPGVAISLNALSSKTAQLPHIGLAPVSRAIADNTVEAMNSGIILGTASMLDGMIDRFNEELDTPAYVAATGAYAKEIIPYCRRDITVHETLILEGLRIIYEKNT